MRPCTHLQGKKMSQERAPLSDVGRLEFSRRMAIVSACVGALECNLPELMAAETALAEFKKSKLAIWCYVFLIGGALLGNYVAHFFYTVAVVALLVYAARIIDTMTLERRKDQFRLRLVDTQILWATAGENSTSLNDLVSLGRKAEGNLQMDSDAYRDWWRGTAVSVENRVRFALNMDD